MGWINRWWHLNQRDETDLIEQDKGSVSYYWILFFSTALSTLGLLIDNVNVIIGAMILAPLMIPLSSLSVGIARGDLRAIGRSTSNLSMSILLILITSAILGRLVPVVGLPDEIVARAQPTVVDLIIALIAGSAAMFAYLNKDVPEGLAGVAVAVALLPPLCVAGLSVSLGWWPIALGATVLFFANMAAIIFSGLIVLWFYQRFSHQEEKKNVALWGGLLSAMVVLVLAVLLSVAFWQSYQVTRWQEVAKQGLTQQLSLSSKSDIQQLRVVSDEEDLVLQAVVKVPQLAELPTLSNLETELANQFGKPVKLILEVIRVETLE